MKYKVTRQVYDRCENNDIRVSTFKADNDIEALKKVIDNCQYGVSKDDFDYNESDLVDMIYACNGDGCDYIYKIENLDEGEVLFEGGEYEECEENW